MFHWIFEILELLSILKLLATFLLICFSSLYLTAQNEVTFTANANARQVTEGSYFQVEFTLINAEWTRFAPPDFQGFQQYGNPSSSLRSSNINGQWTTSKSLVYNVLAKKTGKHTIGPAEAVVNGKTLKTNPIQIEVIKGKKPTADGSASGNVGNNFFVRAEPSTTEARIGQQIALDYKLYTKINIESYDMGQEPAYNGFYTEEVRRFNYKVMREVLDGETYNTKVLKRVALYPQQAGLLTIDPLDLRLGISDQSSGRRRSFFFDQVKYTPYQTDSVQINVLPFPDEMPSNFSGAVGKYSMISSIDKNVLPADDAITITLTIRGNGDVKRVQPPDLNLEESFELYDPTILEEKNFENEGEIIGRKVVEYKVVPKVPGEYVIQPEFTYFDTDSLKFVTINSPPTPITVKKGRKRYSSATSPKSVEAIKDIFPIKKETTLSAKGNYFFGSTLFWVLSLFPFLLLGVAMVYRQVIAKRGNIDINILKSQRAQKVARRKLTQAEKFMQHQDSKAFYDEISRASFGYVCDKLSIPLAELSKANVQEKLQALQVSQQHIDDFIQIIKTCEMALFAGMDNSSAMQETYQKAAEVIVKIEEELS